MTKEWVKFGTEFLHKYIISTLALV